MIGLPFSLNMSRTRNQPLFNIWLHVRPKIRVGILWRYQSCTINTKVFTWNVDFAYSTDINEFYWSRAQSFRVRQRIYKISTNIYTRIVVCIFFILCKAFQRYILSNLQLSISAANLWDILLESVIPFVQMVYYRILQY